MPVSLGCLYLRDSNSPPPQAACNECVKEKKILSICHKITDSVSTYINMEPASMSLANICNLLQWIERTEYSCASRGTNEERNLALCLSFNNGTFQFGRNQASSLIRMDHDAIVCAQTGNSCARLHRVMALIGCEHHQFARQALRSVFLVVREHPMTGRQKCVQIRDRTARCENRVATIPADDFSHFRQHNRFHENENRSNFICEHIRVGGGRQPFARHRNYV